MKGVLIIMMSFLATFPPKIVDGVTPAEAISEALTFFETWIKRAGGIIAFIGAIKFAIAIRSDDERDLMHAMFCLISGFMIVEAITSKNIFNIPSVYGPNLSPYDSFTVITNFITKWAKRVGFCGMFWGAVSFALSIKDNNASSKVSALKAFVAGAMVVAISGIFSMFVL